jgi:hypothetical protein
LKDLFGATKEQIINALAKDEALGGAARRAVDERNGALGYGYGALPV